MSKREKIFLVVGISLFIVGFGIGFYFAINNKKESKDNVEATNTSSDNIIDEVKAKLKGYWVDRNSGYTFVMIEEDKYLEGIYAAEGTGSCDITNVESIDSNVYKYTVYCAPFESPEVSREEKTIEYYIDISDIDNNMIKISADDMNNYKTYEYVADTWEEFSDIISKEYYGN